MQRAEYQEDMFEESPKVIKVIKGIPDKVKPITLASQVSLLPVSQPFTAVRVSPTEVWILHK